MPRASTRVFEARQQATSGLIPGSNSASKHRTITPLLVTLSFPITNHPGAGLSLRALDNAIFLPYILGHSFSWPVAATY